MARIMVVEDDVYMREELTDLLRKSGYETASLFDFENAIPEITEYSPDLVLLDINLPFHSGFEICKELKAKQLGTVLVLTARDKLQDELHALGLGADDYLTKPCNIERLLARIKNLLRRKEEQIRQGLLDGNGFLLDPNTFTIYVGKSSSLMPPNEGKILLALLKKSPNLVTKHELCNVLWGTEECIDENALQVTFASLAIGGILFMVGATFISSWNPDSFARMGNLEDGEYYITINHNTLVNPKPYGISEYQVNTPFSQELMEELQQIPEVKEIYATERTAAIIEYHDEQLEIPIIPITPDNQEEILKTLPVDWTYETLVKQDAMVILGTSVQKEVYHACPSIGEKVTLRWFDGAEHSIDILIAGTSEKSMNEGFYLPKETIEKLWGDMDLTASLTLSVPEYEKVGKSVESKLNNILSRHPDLVMETLQEVKASSANTIHNTSVQVYGVSAFVIMFSIFNLTNTLISRISTRRKEFGILESIGMTKKQIKKMLLHESVLLIIPCLIITVVAGTLMGYLLVRILSANGLTYFQYTFPFIPLLIYGVCLIITPIIISAICLKIQCRNSLVERIKMAD